MRGPDSIQVEMAMVKRGALGAEVRPGLGSARPAVASAEIPLDSCASRVRSTTAGKRRFPRPFVGSDSVLCTSGGRERQQDGKVQRTLRPARADAASRMTRLASKSLPAANANPATRHTRTTEAAPRATDESGTRDIIFYPAASLNGRVRREFPRFGYVATVRFADEVHERSAPVIRV